MITAQNVERLRAAFERLRRNDSFGFKRSRRGTYVNPAVARDWRWFCLGVAYAEQPIDDTPPKE